MKILMIVLMMFTFSMSAMAAIAVKSNGSRVGENFVDMNCKQGMACDKTSGKAFSIKQSFGSAETFASGDTTPAVDSGASYFKTFLNSAHTITDFDGAAIYTGQAFLLYSQGAVSLDVTSSGIKCGTTDISLASGDVTGFVYDGTDWFCTSRIDASDDLN
jgi:hypothetical protein